MFPESLLFFLYFNMEDLRPVFHLSTSGVRKIIAKWN